MFSATMEYSFLENNRERFVNIWQDIVYKAAKGRPGLVSMELLVAKNKAMAIGCWEDSSYAQSFMETGVFKILMKEVQNLLEETPQPRQWERVLSI